MFKILKLELKGVGKYQDIYKIDFTENRTDLDLLIKDGKSTIIKSIINVLGFNTIDDNKYLKSYNYDGDSYIEVEVLFNNKNLIIRKNLHTNEIENSDSMLFELFEKYKDILKNNSVINENNLFEIKNIDTLKEEINIAFNIENLIINNTKELMYVKNVLDINKIYSQEEYDSKLDSMEEEIIKKITKKEKLLSSIKEIYSKLEDIDNTIKEIETNDYLNKLEDSLVSLEEIKKDIFFYRNNLKIKSISFDELKDFLLYINESNLFNKTNLEKIVNFFNLVESNLTKYSNLHIDLVKEVLNDENSTSILEKLSTLESEVSSEEEYYAKFREIFKPNRKNVLINKIFSIFENDFEQMVIIYLKYKEIVNLKLWEKIKQFHKTDDFFLIFDKRNNLLNYIKNIIFYLSNNETVVDRNINKYLEQINNEDFDINSFKTNCRQVNLLFDKIESLEEEIKFYNTQKEIYNNALIERKEINDNLIKEYSYLIDYENLSIKDNLIKNIDLDKNKYKEIQNIKNNYASLVNEFFINKEKNDIEKQKMLLEIEDIIIKVFNKIYSDDSKKITIENNLILLNGMPFEISKNEDKLLYKICYNCIYNTFLNVNVESSVLLIDNILSYIKNNEFNIDKILLKSEDLFKQQLIYSK